MVLEIVAARDHPAELAGGGCGIQFYDSGEPDRVCRDGRSLHPVATESDPGGHLPVCVHHLHGGAVPVGADAPQPPDRIRVPRLGRLFHLQVLKKQNQMDASIFIPMSCNISFISIKKRTGRYNISGVPSLSKGKLLQKLIHCLWR